MSRLHDRYRSEVVPALMKRFGFKNPMAVPKVAKVVVNIGLGEASQNVKLLDVAAAELGQISGQRAVITRAKKSIANFKIRKGMPIGCCVTLRGDRMYEFLDRLCNVVLPRVRDLLSPPAEVVALVKPQFEVGKGAVGKGGIVRDPEQHRRVLSELRQFAEESGYEVAGEVPSPILGAKGNREFLMHLRRNG